MKKIIVHHLAFARTNLPNVYGRRTILNQSSVSTDLELCERAFELTNDPCAPEFEQETSGGACYSLSVGDVVEIAPEGRPSRFYLCCSYGFAELRAREFKAYLVEWQRINSADERAVHLFWRDLADEIKPRD